MFRARAWRTISSACSLFEVSMRAVCGTSAASQRAGSSIHTLAGKAAYRPACAAHRPSARRTPLPDSCPPSPAVPTMRGYPDRTIPLFREAALVDDQATLRLAAKQPVRVPADLRNDRLVVPRRVTDKVLELLRAASLNHGSHRCELADFRLYQSAQVACGNRRAVAGMSAEEPAVAVDQRCESLCKLVDQRCGQL